MAEKEIVLNLNKSSESTTKKSDKVLDLVVKCFATTANGEEIMVGFININAKMGLNKGFMEKLRNGEMKTRLEVSEDSTNYYEALEF